MGAFATKIVFNYFFNDFNYRSYLFSYFRPTHFVTPWRVVDNNRLLNEIYRVVFFSFSNSLSVFFWHFKASFFRHNNGSLGFFVSLFSICRYLETEQTVFKIGDDLMISIPIYTGIIKAELSSKLTLTYIFKLFPAYIWILKFRFCKMIQ